MKLENQVCSLESAKRLKELSVNKDSLYYWYNCTDHPGEWRITDIKLNNDLDKETSAYTVAELGEMLPSGLVTSGRKYKDIFMCVYGNPEIDLVFKEEKTEAEARAKMLIYLLENNIIKAEDLK